MSKDNVFKLDERGFSSSQMVVTIACVGILATITFPLLTPVIEMAEVLIAEKYLLGAVKQCQMGLINDENFPSYTIRQQSLGIGLITNRRYQFQHTGYEGECLDSSSGNILSAARMSQDHANPIFSLNINLVTGEKTTEGEVPSFIDWWKGIYSPFIDADDLLLF